MKSVEMYVVSYFIFYFYLNGFFISCDTIDLFVQTPIDDFLPSFSESIFFLFLDLFDFEILCSLCSCLGAELLRT